MFVQPERLGHLTVVHVKSEGNTTFKLCMLYVITVIGFIMNTLWYSPNPPFNLNSDDPILKTDN